MSSTQQTTSWVVVAIRALIMLSCLIFIPAVALFRTPLMKLFDSVFRHEPAAASSRAPVVPTSSRTYLPHWPDAEGRSRELTEAPAFLPESAIAGQPQPASAEQPRGHLARASQIIQVRASDRAPPLEDLEKQLQYLGATYYFLEYVAQENRYRFFCRVEGNDRPFEAWGTDSRATMRAVVRQIADWRAARYPVGPSGRLRSPSSGPWGEVGRDRAPSTAIRPRPGRSGS